MRGQSVFCVYVCLSVCMCVSVGACVRVQGI